MTGPAVLPGSFNKGTSSVPDIRNAHHGGVLTRFPHFPAVAAAIPDHLLRPNIDTFLFNTDVFTVKYMSNHKKLEIKCQAKTDTTLSLMEFTVSGGDRLNNPSC